MAAKAQKVTQMPGRPAKDPIAREKQLIARAVDLAEKQLIDGTASPSVINHYLKAGSSREKLDRENLEKQISLLTAKVEAINNDKDAAASAKQAIEAMKNYSSSNGQ